MFGIDLALIKPPLLQPIERFADSAKESIIGECLGLAYISAYCKSKNLEVDYIDCSLLGISDEQLIERLVERRPRLVGILTRYPFLDNIKQISEQLKVRMPNVHILIGGQYASLDWKYLLEMLGSVDSVCVGDGEQATYDLYLYLIGKAGNVPSSIRMRNYRQNEYINISRISIEESAKQLDDLPWVDRSYLQIAQDMGYKTVGISSSRGCPFRCEFCVPQQYSQLPGNERWKFRSAKNVAEEIEFLIMQGHSLFTFSDEHFIPHELAKRRAIELADHLQPLYRDQEIRYMFDCRADSVEINLFAKLRESGLYRVFVGFETIEQESLRLLKKDAKLAAYYNAVEVCKSLDIEIIPGFIFFHPFSTLQSIRATLEFHSEVFSSFDLDDFTTSLAAVAGTPIIGKLARENLLCERRGGTWGWKFRDGRLGHVYMLFHEVVSRTTNEFLSLKNHKKSLLLLKVRVIQELIDILASFESSPELPPMKYFLPSRLSSPI